MKAFEFFGSRVYRFSTLIVTLFLTLFIFYTHFYPRPTRDVVPIIEAITPDKYKEWGKHNGIVETGIFILSTDIIDAAENKFYADVFIWFQFDPRVISIDAVSKFTFSKASISQKELVESKIMGEQVYLRYHVRFDFISVLNYRYFPFDSHRLYIILRNDYVDPWELFYVSYYTKVIFAPTKVTLNWDYSEPDLEFGYVETVFDTIQPDITDYIPAVSFFFDFERSSTYDQYMIFLPLMALFFMILGALLISSTLTHSIVVGLIGITALLVYRVVTNSVAPATEYYMLNDMAYFLIFLCICIRFAFELLNAIYKPTEEFLAKLIYSLSLTITCTIFLVGWFYIFCIW